jgi:hypothetical protein
MSIQVQDSNSNMVGSNSRLINTLKIVEYSKRRRQAVPSHIINTSNVMILIFLTFFITQSWFINEETCHT